MIRRVAGCTGKKRYNSHGEAITACIKTSGKFAKPMRPYRCGHCKSWHITSRIG